MTKTLLSDPGVLPCGLDPSPDMEWKVSSSEKDLGRIEVGEWVLVPRWVKIEAATSENQDQDQVEWIQVKWCASCLTFRPPRSSHCRVCDCCIDVVSLFFSIFLNG